MLHEALEPDNARAVRVGVGSPNLYEVAYALVLANERGVLDHVQFDVSEDEELKHSGERARLVPSSNFEDRTNGIGHCFTFTSCD